MNADIRSIGLCFSRTPAVCLLKATRPFLTLEIVS